MKSILIVEDNQAIILGIEKLLLSENYELLTSTDGREGLQTALDKLPSLVLLDINLPSINGFDILSWSKGDGQYLVIGEETESRLKEVADQVKLDI